MVEISNLLTVSKSQVISGNYNLAILKTITSRVVLEDTLFIVSWVISGQ